MLKTMSSATQQRFITLYVVTLLLINIIQSAPIENVKLEQNHQKKNDEHSTHLSRFEILEQLLNRRSLYDPAFESWSDSFEKKRNIFDPAYGDWSNTFKRENQ